MPEGQLTPEDAEEVQRLARIMAREELTKIWSGQANIEQVVPTDLVWRGRGIYHSASEGWFTKGPGGSLMHLAGPPGGM